MIINTRPEKQARRLGYKIEQAELNYSNIPITDITQRNFLSKDEISNLKKVYKLTNKDELLLIDNLNLTITKKDWDSYETSWDFSSLILIDLYQGSESLETTYNNLRI